MGRTPSPERYLLRTEAVHEHLERKHLTHEKVAAALKLSKSYWSQLVHRHRRLPAELRQRMRESGIFDGLADDELWEKVGGGVP